MEFSSLYLKKTKDRNIMDKKENKYYILILIFFMIFYGGGCSFSNSQNEEQHLEPRILYPGDIGVVTHNQAAKLIYKIEEDNKEISFQWYKSLDGSKENALPLEGANYFEYETSFFTNKGIQYYYCIAISDEMEFSSDIITVGYTGLPIVNIDLEDHKVPTTDKKKRYGRLSLIKDGNKVYDSGEKNNFSIKVRGNGTATLPKLSYKLKLPEEENLLDIKDQSQKDKDWVLLANYCDKTLLRTKIGFYTQKMFNSIPANAQLFVPQSEFVDVILNEEYIGNYLLTESVKEGKNRCNINTSQNDIDGIGFVAEYDYNYYANEDFYFKSDIKAFPYTFKYPDTDDSNFMESAEYFQEFINEFEYALYNNSDDWLNYIDLESFARFFIVHNMLANIDTNYFITKKSSNNNSKLVMEPCWDFDWSLGIGWYSGERPRPENYWCIIDQEIHEWYFSELLKHVEFINEIKYQWRLLKAEYSYVYEDIRNNISNWSENISISQILNFKRWDIMNEHFPIGGVPMGSYEKELECDLTFLEKRIAWFDKEICILGN